MLIQVTNGSCKTEKLTTKLAQKLLKCDEITTFNECGWFVVVGYKNEEFMGRRKSKIEVKAHCKSKKEYKNIMNCADPDLFPEVNRIKKNPKNYGQSAKRNFF